MLKMEDIVPIPSKIKLGEKEYELRPFSMDDEIWLQRTYGDALEGVFKQMRMQEICRIVFHQLKEEDKQDFKQQTAKIIGEDGSEETITTGGYKLIYAMLVGMNDKVVIVDALLDTIGISRPIREKLAAEDAAQKKSQETQSIGGTSSISSDPNTDGQPNTSSH